MTPRERETVRRMVIELTGHDPVDEQEDKRMTLALVKALAHELYAHDLIKDAIERALLACVRIGATPTRKSVRIIAWGFLGELVDAELDRMLAREAERQPQKGRAA